MKKIAMLMIALMLAITVLTTASASAAAEQNTWYELSAENTVLTVRLPGDNWDWEITNPEELELITQESNDGLIASFMSTIGAPNTVALILRRVENEAEAAIETRVLEIDIDENNVLSVNAVLIAEPAAEWYEMDEEVNVLTVRLPGSDWDFEIVDPQIAELITMDTSEGNFVASFMPTFSEYGMSQLVFINDNGMETRAIDIFVIESGEMTATRAEVFTILE